MERGSLERDSESIIARFGLTRPHIEEGTRKREFTLIVGRGDDQRGIRINHRHVWPDPSSLRRGVQKREFTLIVGRSDVQRVFGIGIVKVGLTRTDIEEGHGRGNSR